MQLLVVTLVSTGKWLHRFLWWFQQANGCTGFCGGFSRQMVVQVFVVVSAGKWLYRFLWWFQLAIGGDICMVVSSGKWLFL